MNEYMNESMNQSMNQRMKRMMDGEKNVRTDGQKHKRFQKDPTIQRIRVFFDLMQMQQFFQQFSFAVDWTLRTN